MRKLVLLLLVLASCTTERVVEVPVEAVRIERIYNTKTDSIIIRDSIDSKVINDTVYVYREHISYRNLNTVDTICLSDTIYTIEEKEVVKEVNVLHWYQKILIYAGLCFILFCIGYIVYKFKK